eukprot:8841762-Pyramimonas_sp.AAC.1
MGFVSMSLSLSSVLTSSKARRRRSPHCCGAGGLISTRLMLPCPCSLTMCSALLLSPLIRGAVGSPHSASIDAKPGASAAPEPSAHSSLSAKLNAAHPWRLDQDSTVHPQYLCTPPLVDTLSVLSPAQSASTVHCAGASPCLESA